MRFITLIAKNVLNRPVRTALTAIGLAVAIAAVVILVGISWNFERSFLAIYQSKGIDLIVVHAGSSNQLSSSLDVRLADRLRKIDGRGRRGAVAGRHGRLRGQEPGERAGQRLGAGEPAVPGHPHPRRAGRSGAATTRRSCSGGCWR